MLPSIVPAADSIHPPRSNGNQGVLREIALCTAQVLDGSDGGLVGAADGYSMNIWEALANLAEALLRTP
jgi:hypothetical protein